jgi:hypothetical protein
MVVEGVLTTFASARGKEHPETYFDSINSIGDWRG